MTQLPRPALPPKLTDSSHLRSQNSSRTPKAWLVFWVWDTAYILLVHHLRWLTQWPDSRAWDSTPGHRCLQRQEGGVAIPPGTFCNAEHRFHSRCRLNFAFDDVIFICPRPLIVSWSRYLDVHLWYLKVNDKLFTSHPFLLFSLLWNFYFSIFYCTVGFRLIYRLLDNAWLINFTKASVLVNLERKWIPPFMNISFQFCKISVVFQDCF